MTPFRLCRSIVKTAQEKEKRRGDCEGRGGGGEKREGLHAELSKRSRRFWRLSPLRSSGRHRGEKKKKGEKGRGGGETGGGPMRSRGLLRQPFSIALIAPRGKEGERGGEENREEEGREGKETAQCLSGPSIFWLSRFHYRAKKRRGGGSKEGERKEMGVPLFFLERERLWGGKKGKERGGRGREEGRERGRGEGREARDSRARSLASTTLVDFVPAPGGGGRRKRGRGGGGEGIDQLAGDSHALPGPAMRKKETKGRKKEKLDNAVMLSSLMPSTKYSCSVSPLSLGKKKRGRERKNAQREGGKGRALA